VALSTLIHAYLYMSVVINIRNREQVSPEADLDAEIFA